MTKEQYISQLNYNLRNMSEAERLEAVRYYGEYLDDAFENGGEVNLNKAMEELGDPKRLAGKILADSALKKLDNDNKDVKVKDKASSVWIVILAVLSSPIWSPFVFVAFVLLAALFVVVLSLVISAIAILISGIVVVAGGTAVTLTHIPTAVFIIGTGLICIGIGIFAVLLTVKLLSLFFKGVIWLIGKIFGKQRG